MDIKLSGSVVQILKEQNGTGKNGPWRKRDFILEIPGKYPKKVCITQWGENIDQQAVAEGQQFTVSIDLQSREYNGNWYTDVKAWKVEAGSGEQNAPPQTPPPSAEGYTIEGYSGTTLPDDVDDDLPF